MGKPSETMSYFEIDDSWKFELEEFISSVKGEGKIINGTIQDAKAIMLLIDEIYSRQ